MGESGVFAGGVRVLLGKDAQAKKKNTDDADPSMVVKVAATGIGMPEELIDKIFIPFFSTKKSGSGIGLSLCKQIMMLHCGQINVNSVEGEGTAFNLQF